MPNGLRPRATPDGYPSLLGSEAHRQEAVNQPSWLLQAAGGLEPADTAQGLLTLTAVLGPARWVSRNGWQSLRRGILNDHVLAAAAALAGLAGGAWGLWRGDLQDGALFAASVYVLASHAAGGYTSVPVHVRASQAVRRLLALQSQTAVRLGPDSAEEEVSVEALRPGDRVRIRPGQRMPVDGVVIADSSAVDPQLITGEASPWDGGPGDEVVGGSLNLTGTLVVEVTRVGEQNFLRQVARQWPSPGP